MNSLRKTVYLISALNAFHLCFSDDETECIIGKSLALTSSNDKFADMIMSNLNSAENSSRKKRGIDMEQKGLKILSNLPKIKTQNLFDRLKGTFNVNRGLTFAEKTNKFAAVLLAEFKKIFSTAFIQEAQGYKLYPWTPSNVIGILSGENRGKPDDKILVIGAHYDTISRPDVKGILDSGSGVTVMMEIAKILQISKWKLKYTVMFVAFDLHEVGLLGSKSFMEEYLIPKELDAKKGSFQGAIILDTLLSYSTKPNSQDISPDLKNYQEELAKTIEKNDKKGDFVILNYRKVADKELAEKLLYYWGKVGNPGLKLFLTPIEIDKLRAKEHTSITEFESGDHRSFWLASSDNNVYRAVRINDGGFTRDGGRCMHEPCGNIQFVSPKGLKLMKKVGETITAVILDLQDATLQAAQQQKIL